MGCGAFRYDYRGLVSQLAAGSQAKWVLTRCIVYAKKNQNKLCAFSIIEVWQS